MEYCGRWAHFLPSFLLILTIFGIFVCSSFRIGDKNSKIERIPFTRVKPDVGFLQRTNIDFDREVRHPRERRSVADIKISHEFELKGDNHSVAFLHWAGKKSPVIYIYTCEKVTQTKSGHLNCENAYFWRSVDYGDTFKREEGSISSKSISISDVEFCPSNHKKVIISDVKDKMLYISENEGSQYISVPVRKFSPHVVSCNPASDKWLVSHDLATHKLYYSSDGGNLWQTLSEKVLKYYWGPKEFGSSQSTIFLEVQKGPFESELRYAQIPFDFNNVKIFDEHLGNFLSYSLEVEGRYIFVQKDVPEGLRLFVLFKNGSTSSKNFFQKAHFPLDHIQQGYKILDASESEVLVSVKHKGFSNLYVSDVTGLKYSLSLENILMARSSVWGQNTTMVDIHQVRSLNGTYLANVLIHNADGDKVRSVISFNKGGDWYLLKSPAKDHNGNPTNCNPPQCSLHIHIVLSQQYYYIPSVLSSPSAVGLIIAQGNLGDHLGQGIGVFLSRDGGLTWTKEFDSFYDFMIGDHGGIITAVGMRSESRTVWYSCTEGRDWKNVTLGSKPVYVFGIVTEPGETTLIFNVFGHYAGEKFRWLSVKLNFTSVLSQKCGTENYTFWSPNDERADGQCMLGQHMVFERRKAEDCCFNGKEYERKFNITPCTCGAEDFDCDFGYKHHSLDEVCVATSAAVIVPDPCPEGKTYQHTHGYRKVSGDRCKGGVEDQLKPDTRFCPLKGPDELKVHLKAGVNYTVARDRRITFELSQQKGSKVSTVYTWDFGDNSEVVAFKGLNNAKSQTHVFKKHGQFTVSVRAENKAGKAVDEIIISVVDEITRVQIKPPHAVIIGEEAVFGITLYSNNSKEKESAAQHGYVHFMWFFDSSSTPVLTLDFEVAHTFHKPGKYEVSVTVITVVGYNKDAHATITVYKALTTVRLSFDKLLDTHNQKTDEWRASFSQRLQATLVSLLQVESSRLEVTVLNGLPTTADVSIIPAPTNQSKTRQQIIELLQLDVNAGIAEVQLPGQITIRITHVEVLPDRGVMGEPTTLVVEVPEKDNRLAVAIGISASLIVVFLVVILVYFFRRYNRLQSRYSRLRLTSDGEQLRDPLIQNEDGDEDEGLHPQPGGSFRYVPVATQNAELDSDEDLLDNLNPGPLYIMPGDDTAPNSQNT